MILVSIIVPIFNVEQYLSKCVDSLLKQTLREIEIILVDDGSSDNCNRICEEYAKKDARIKVIHQENAGVSAARNSGLNAATGKFIGFVDPDDWIEPQMYEEMLNELERTKVDLVICGYNYYDDSYHSDETRIYKLKKTQLLDREDLYKSMSDMPPTVRHGVVTKLFRQDLIGDLRFDTELRSSEDLQFLLNYFSKTSSASFIHKPFYNNLVRKGSATHGALNIKSLKDSFRVHESMYKATIKQFPHLKDYAQAYLLDVCMLKYKEARAKTQCPSHEEKECLSYMRRFICRHALSCLLNKKINWKIRLIYNRLWIRK